MNQTMNARSRVTTANGVSSRRAAEWMVSMKKAIAPSTIAMFTTSMIQPLEAWTSRSKLPFLFVAVDMTSSRGG